MSWNVLRSFSSLCIRQNLSFGRSIPVRPSFLASCFSTDSKDLPKLKKAKGPYLQFCDEKRSEVFKSNPSFNVKDVSKVLGQMWRTLTETEKQPYSLKFEIEKKEVEASNMAILEALTPEQKEQLKEEKIKKAHSKKLKNRKKLWKEYNRPKAENTNPFLLYLNDLDRGDADAKMFIRGASDQWKKMTEEDKEKYIAEAKENSAKFKVEIGQWEMKMFNKGNHDLLSPSKLKKMTQANESSEKSKTRKTKKRSKSAKSSESSNAEVATKSEKPKETNEKNDE